MATTKTHKSRKPQSNKTDPETRFWAGVRRGPPEECWEWQKFKSGGYGLLKGEGRSNLYAHRYSFAIHNGPIPSGLVVMHSCDNRACVNPAHLSLGTHQDNVADKVSKNRQPRGSLTGQAKLTEQQIPTIRRLLACGMAEREVASTYHVCQATINMIKHNKIWRHVPESAS